MGQWQEAETAIQESLRLLQAQGDRAVLAQVLNTQGSLQLAKGQTEAAFETWKQAEAAYIASGDRVGQWGSIMNQAQALQALVTLPTGKNDPRATECSVTNLTGFSPKSLRVAEFGRYFTSGGRFSRIPTSARTKFSDRSTAEPRG
uniref:Tetratricopeptide repeat protein n=1 Tax=Desertifilum tharense IPPAS B-1220 TaxID=1781255 RepID=A0ACD5H2U7_9CYAN